MTDTDPARLRQRELDDAMERVSRRNPPPKMVVIHQGWFRDKVTRKSVEELQQEDRTRAARG